jgi:hypothetical protein
MVLGIAAVGAISLTSQFREGDMEKRNVVFQAHEVNVGQRHTTFCGFPKIVGSQEEIP